MTTVASGPDLGVDIGGLQLKNPVMTASGTFGYGGEFRELVDLGRLGAIIVKGVSLSPTKGNPPPRVVETHGGMLNAIGLENIGFDALAARKLPALRSLGTPVLVNIYGRTEEEYGRLAERVEETDGIDGVEVNISCPNVKAGGAAFGTDPRAVARVVRTVRSRTRKPVMVKLSPNVTDIVSIARAAEGEGADSLSLINTLTAMAVDIHTRRPRLANITGGLSGPAIKPVALRMVWQVARAVRVPVVGIGGIMTWSDAVEFLMVGASAVQVGTANLVNPRATMEIIDGLRRYLAEQGIARAADVVNTLADA